MAEIIKDFGSITVPKSWNDITLKQFQEISRYYGEQEEQSNFDVRDILTILINKDVDYINELPSEFLETILTHLAFIVTTPEVKEPSNKIVIDGEEYIVHNDKQLKTGEYIAADTALKGDKYNYAAILAIICRKEGEKYDSRFENEILEDRIKLFEKQPVINILPIINFFLSCYIILQTPTRLSSQIEETINLIQQNGESLVANGEISKHYMKSVNKKLKKLKKSIKSI